MDSDNPMSRVERTLWTVWYYISGAVSRFLRPEPANITPSDSIQESEHANVGDADRGGGGEEQPLAAASLLNSSRPLVAWELCSTDRESAQYKASEEGEGMREQQAELSVTNKDKQEENRAQKCNAGGPDEMCEDMEESGRKDDEEDTEQPLSLKTEDTVVRLCPVSLEEEHNDQIEEAKVQRKEADTAAMHEEVENIDDVPQFASDEGDKQVEDQLSVCEDLSKDNSCVKGFTSLNVNSHMLNNESVPVSEVELSAVEQEHLTACRNVSDEQDRTVVIEEADVCEAANNQTRGDNDMETEDGQERVDVQKAELDVGKDTAVQSKPKERDDDETESHRWMINEASDVTKTHISVEERFLDVDRLEGERQVKESYMTIACTTTSVRVEVEGLTGQEMSGGFKNIPTETCEGRVVVSQELNFPAYKETEEGVPEHNNESRPDGNTTQSILEGDNKERLPEGLESLENSGCSTEADCFPLRGHMEEEREGTEDLKNSVDVRQEMEEQLAEAVIQESSSVCEEEDGDLLVDSMRKGIESNVYLSDETKELLVEFGIDKGSCDSTADSAAAGHSSETKGAVTAEAVLGFADETEAQKMSFFQEFLDPINSEPNIIMTANLLDITESGFCKTSDETMPTLVEDVLMQDVGIDMEEARGFVLQSKTEILHLPESEFPLEVEIVEGENQQSDKAYETSEDMLTEPEAADEPKDLTWISKVTKHVEESEARSAKESVHSIGGHPDVWLQAALSEDTSSLKQHEGLEPTKEEQDKVSSVQTKMVKKQLGESNSGESEFVSDAESGFLDQSLSDWGTQNSEIQLLKTTSHGSFQGIYDRFAHMSESIDISELSTQQSDSESQMILMEEEVEKEQSHLKREEFIANVLLTLEEKSEHERAESVETGSGSQKETDVEVTAWKDTEEARDESLTGMSVLLKAVSDSASEPNSSGSVVLLDEEMEFTDSGSQGNTSASKRKLPSVDVPELGWSEDTARSLPGLNRDVVAKDLKSDQMETETSALDFTAQRWRIAVKNPHVRPPKNPRSLLHMPSVDPTPVPPLSANVPAGVPLGGLGFGIKLPGLGAGFPVLKKTPYVIRGGNSLDNVSQETKPEESDISKEDEAEHKPKWMPPRHPGFGNPLMSELKTKLKKTTKQ